MAKTLMSFDEVIGQVNIVRWFKSCIQRDRLPQVIMLTGPAGIGKTSMATLAACEIACIPKPSLLSKTKEAVITERKSTDCVKLYNMSNLKSQDAVQEVKADLQVGLSSTGRKVIIMDEGHGMSQEAQDSLLTTFEALPLNVYVIICSTNLENFGDAFLSRVILRRLTNLNMSEMRRLLKSKITDRQLKFQVGENMAISLISNYSGREPRRALNLIESFDEGSIVSNEDLDTFFNVHEGKQLVTLINYMYHGELLKGLDFINEFEFGTTFGATLLDILRTSLNGKTNILDKDSTLFIRELVSRKGSDKLIKFTIKCTSYGKLSRNKVAAYFLECATVTEKQALPKEPVRLTQEQIQLEDLSIMSSMIEETAIVGSSSDNLAPSLEALLSNSETVI